MHNPIQTWIQFFHDKLIHHIWQLKLYCNAHPCAVIPKKISREPLHSFTYSYGIREKTYSRLSRFGTARGRIQGFTR